jgi:carboxypeptidase Q
MRRRHVCSGLASGWALGSAAHAAAPVSSLSVPDAVYAESDRRHARELIARAASGSAAWRLMRELCTGVGARPAGSPADARARAWALQQLSSLGLEQVHAQMLPLRIWQRVSESAVLLGPEPRPLVVSALGNSVGTPAAGLEAELVGYPDLASLVADHSERARGRIVFIDQKTERTRDGRGYGAAVGARVNGAVEAARRGALGLAIRSIGTSQVPVAHTGAMRVDLSVPRIPALAVSVPDAEHIAALLGSPQAPPLRLQMKLQTRSGVDAETANVVAEWRGTDLAHEVVLIGAHLDSWDVGEGAQDDGAGVAIVAAAAGLIAAAGERARRTIRVVLFGNEENGFDGAQAYAARYGHVTHQLVAESDFGAGRIGALAVRVQAAALPAAREIGALLAPLGVDIPAEGFDKAQPGPDAALLMRRRRWPAAALYQDGSRYFDVHHTAHDTWAEWARQGTAADLDTQVAAWAVLAWLAAQAPVAFGPLEP